MYLLFKQFKIELCSANAANIGTQSLTKSKRDPLKKKQINKISNIGLKYIKITLVSHIYANPEQDRT